MTEAPYPVSAKQYGLIQILARELCMTSQDLDDLTIERYGSIATYLTRE